MSEALETVVESVYPKENPCASGACPMPVPEEVVESEVNKGDFVIFNLRDKKRSGTVISKGKVHLGIDLTEMISNTKIPAETEFVELKGVKVFVEKALLNVEAEQAA